MLGHGDGGITAPPLDLPRDDGAHLVACFRGLGRSRCPPISEDPNRHVLHDIDQRNRYILGDICAVASFAGAAGRARLQAGLTRRRLRADAVEIGSPQHRNEKSSRLMGRILWRPHVPPLLNPPLVLANRKPATQLAP